MTCLRKKIGLLYYIRIFFWYFFRQLNNENNSLLFRRLFPGDHPKELYVCYHQSVPQSAVELAFKLGFGVWPYDVP